MIIGGFNSVDLNLLNSELNAKEFNLRCDSENVYNRKIFVGNGRTAASYVLKNAVHLTHNDVILLPDYLCVSVINSLQVCDAQLRFYRVKKDLSIDLDDLKAKMNDDVAMIYVIHYFGFPMSREVQACMLSLKKKYNAVIMEDLTQALYSTEKDCIGFGDYITASIRKWTPVTDGGMLAIRDDVNCKEVKLANAYDEAVYKQLMVSLYRDYYDKHSDLDINRYLQVENEANKARYIDFTPREMTLESQKIFFNIDHAALVKQMRDNYSFLYDELKNVDGLKLVTPELDSEGKYVPFGFFVLVEDRDSFYNYLIENRIIPVIQWELPLDYYHPGEDARYLSNHNVMIYCDDRYGTKEMKIIADTIKNYFGGK
ncbi:MAG: aminotransferase class I/II-fold pyridoxal phosphate-dependent enzyme [Eubacteriaceae bacterium]|jgi:dTDP-4-amino-4,6-dideoxygalactose transaminase|nr:aminotransferase class I/II-fold pyridoxal phosphate-dependent enzyme [Eubacteriaceae bacterium]